MRKKYYIFILFILFITRCGNNEKELTVWIGGAPQEIEFWQNKVSQFRDSTGININLVRQPTYSDQRRQSLLISLEAKQPNPDLFLMDVIWINQFYRSGWLLPLDSSLEKSGIKESVYFQKALNLVDRYNDSLYALPVFMDVALLYYRKDLLDNYGYKSPPQTWEELAGYSGKIIKQEKEDNANFTGFVWQGAQYEGLVCSFIEFINSNGGGISTNGHIKIDNKRNISALKFMSDLIHKYKVSPENTYTEMKEEEARRAFQKGNALFERNWTYAAKLHSLNDSKVKGKFGITKLPHFKGESSYSTMGGWHIGISKYSDRKKDAWKFVEFVSSYKFQKEMILQIGWNPARKDIYRDKEVLNKMPYSKIMEDVFNNAVSRPNLPYYPQVSEVIQRNVNNCLAGSITAAKAIEHMQDELDELVKLYEE